ncbi:MAG TPA: BTAD domain-containing putative transcriptional regulator [Anaerolineales bacterium]|nr:BTAD domain-containing putative transcriptional regulator [Anaerolineales bacterium]
MSSNQETSSAISNHVQWEIRFFGGLQVIREGQPISPPPYRTYGLLAFLCLWDKLPVRRERLGGLLYPDLPEKKVRGRLSDYIWQLKKHLPGFPLVTAADQINLDKQSIWVDVKAFKTKIDDPSSHLSEKFIELYQGELLPELYDDWVLVERERWHSHYLRALRNLVNNLLAAGDNGKAISRMERLLREEPFDESVIRLLMQTHLKIGRRGAALAAFENFQLLSKKQLGMEPDKKTRQLYQAIKSQATIPRSTLQTNDVFSKTPANPDMILKQAQLALEQGNRSELNRLRDTLPKELSYDQTLWMSLLEFDEKLMWGELEEAETILQKYDVSSPTLRLRKARMASARNEHVKAKEMVDSLLDDAHRLRQPELEAEALLMLSSINSDLGEIQDSLGAMDRAISLARKIEAHTIRVQAYLQKGKYWRLKGAEESAFDILKQAEQISRKYNLRPLLCMSLGALATTSNYYGDYQAGVKYGTESLEVARDLGLLTLEATSLLSLNYAFDFLGRHFEAGKALLNAVQIYEELNDDFGMAKCYYNIGYGFVNVTDEDPTEAVEFGEKALKIFKEVNNLGYQASTHTALGYFHWLAGNSDQALVHYDEAIEIHTALDEHLFIPELFAFKGLVYIQKGNPKKGLELTQLSVRELARQNLSDVYSEIYYAHACAHKAMGNDHDSKAYVRLGYEIYLETAGKMEDDKARNAYFERGPITRRLMQMAYEYGIAPQPQKTVATRELPGSGHHSVNLQLTTDAGAADQALKAEHGVTALRRARLKRILHEGSSHGGQLSIKEMAEMLNVSPRTIHRDLKIIQKEQI